MAVSNKVALSDKKEVKELLEAARAIRTYCMLTSKAPTKSEALIKALEAFDSDDKVNVSQLTALRIAMRDVCQDIDEYTLTQILQGNSPVGLDGPQRKQNTDENEPEPNRLKRISSWIERIWPKMWQRGILPGIAVFLLLAAMHFTQWSFQANQLLNRLDEHLATDVYSEVRDLIVVASAIHTAKDNVNSSHTITPTQKVFNQSMNKLQAYHFQEVALREATSTKVTDFNLFTSFGQGIKNINASLFRSRVRLDTASAKKAIPKQNAKNILAQEKSGSAKSPGVVKENVTNSQNKDLASKEPTQADETGVEDPSEYFFAAVTPTLGQRDGYLEVVNLIAEKTGRSKSFAGGYVSARLTLEKSSEDLVALIAYANRFFLPIIYGALGATLFCLIRVLTPSLSDLGPARAFLRILFGAFAAMTLSMLFIPANIFTINEQSNPTLIFLACFLFGYSFGAVMTSLHRMEAFLAGRLKTGEKPPQGG